LRIGTFFKYFDQNFGSGRIGAVKQNVRKREYISKDRRRCKLIVTSRGYIKFNVLYVPRRVSIILRRHRWSGTTHLRLRTFQDTKSYVSSFKMIVQSRNTQNKSNLEELTTFILVVHPQNSISVEKHNTKCVSAPETNVNQQDGGQSIRPLCF
jgi:hypothetical protein